MICEKVTYTDYNGTERTESYYFNLTEQELAELNFSTAGGIVKMIERAVNAKDEQEVGKLFKTFLDASYGEKSPDGRRFRKNAEVLEDFKSSPAYSIIYMKLLTDMEEANRFLKGMLNVPDTAKPNGLSVV